MFVEFDSSKLNMINNMSYDQMESAILNNEIKIAVDIDIKIENHSKILEEHKYYQIFTFGNCRLINDIVVSKITEKETSFYIKIGNESQLFTVNNNEEKDIIIGSKPYSCIYKIRVSNIKYGKVLEL